MMLSQRINRSLAPVPAWPIYCLAPLPPAFLLWQAQTGALGPEPINALERELGELGLQLLILVLAVTPLRQFTGANLTKFRRALGLVTFFIISLHLTVWLVLDVQTLERVWSDIVKRPYITVGMIAFTLLIPAAITSNNVSIRKLGPKRWKNLHKWTYLAAVLGAVHYVMVQKVWETEPLIYLAIIFALLATRLDLTELRRADA